MADRDLTEEEVADLKEAFAMFDINGDGMYVSNSPNQRGARRSNVCSRKKSISIPNVCPSAQCTHCGLGAWASRIYWHNENKMRKRREKVSVV
jgi:hypothetical protein